MQANKCSSLPLACMPPAITGGSSLAPVLITTFWLLPLCQPAYHLYLDRPGSGSKCRLSHGQHWRCGSATWDGTSRSLISLFLSRRFLIVLHVGRQCHEAILPQGRQEPMPGAVGVIADRKTWQERNCVNPFLRGRMVADTTISGTVSSGDVSARPLPSSAPCPGP